MPAYPVPPWLHPPDYTGAFIAGQRLRAEMEMQQQRLAQQTQMAGIEAAVKQQQAQQESMLAQQRIEVAKAQQQQEAALRMQELQQAQQKIEIASQAAARKYQAMQEYQSRIQSGADPLKTILELGPAMGQQSSAEAAAIRANAMANKPAGIPQFGVDPSGNQYMYNPLTGHAQYSPRRGDQGLTENQILNAKLRQKRDALSGIPRDPDIIAAMSPEEKQALKDARKRADDLDAEINDLLKRGARHPDLIPVERDGKKGFIHSSELDAARNEMDADGNPVYKLPDDVPAATNQEVQGDEEYP